MASNTLHDLIDCCISNLTMQSFTTVHSELQSHTVQGVFKFLWRAFGHTVSSYSNTIPMWPPHISWSFFCNFSSWLFKGGFPYMTPPNRLATIPLLNTEQCSCPLSTYIRQIIYLSGLLFDCLSSSVETTFSLSASVAPNTLSGAQEVSAKRIKMRDKRNSH